MDLVSINQGASSQINNADISATIHQTNGHSAEEIKLQIQRQDEIAKMIREREAQLSVEARAATTRDILRAGNDGDGGDDEMCTDDDDMMRCSGCEGCWHRDCADSPACDDKRNRIKNWLCSKFFVSGVDSGGDDGDGSGNEHSSSGGDDSGDEASDSGSSKSAKSRASRSPYIDPVEAKEEEDSEVIKANTDAQRELAKKKKEDQPISDTRYLTRNDVTEAVRQMKAEIEIDGAIIRKMEKEPTTVRHHGGPGERHTG
ncbi:unnamed protein product [Ectocarpus sp. 12 AP-2014]